MLFDWPPFPQDSSVEAIFSVTDFVLARLLYDFSRVENRHIFVNVVILIALSQCLSISSSRKEGIELSMNLCLFLLTWKKRDLIGVGYMSLGIPFLFKEWIKLR